MYVRRGHDYYETCRAACVRCNAACDNACRADTVWVFQRFRRGVLPLERNDNEMRYGFAAASGPIIVWTQCQYEPPLDLGQFSTSETVPWLTPQELAYIVCTSGNPSYKVPHLDVEPGDGTHEDYDQAWNNSCDDQPRPCKRQRL